MGSVVMLVLGLGPPGWPWRFPRLKGIQMIVTRDTFTCCFLSSFLQILRGSACATSFWFISSCFFTIDDNLVLLYYRWQGRSSLYALTIYGDLMIVSSLYPPLLFESYLLSSVADPLFQSNSNHLLVSYLWWCMIFQYCVAKFCVFLYLFVL